jgi:hypothetical protein
VVGFLEIGDYIRKGLAEMPVVGRREPGLGGRATNVLRQ